MRVYDASRRHDYKEYEDVCETVQEFWGTGGGNVPIVVTDYVDVAEQSEQRDD